MSKKTVRSSNLALRFYEKDGWVRKELEDCLEKGGVEPNGTGCDSYFLLTVGSRFDLNKLLPKVSKVVRAFDDYPEETDEEFIKGHMW